MENLQHRLQRRDGSFAIDIQGPVAVMHPDDVGQPVVHGSRREFVRAGASYEDPPMNTVKVLLATDEFVMFEAFRAKGSIDVAHVHPDHYSIVFLKKGRIRLRLGRETHIMEEGDTCYHARGMLHQHEALEDSIRVETKVFVGGGAVAKWNRLMGMA